MTMSLHRTLTSHHFSIFFSFSFALEIGGAKHESNLDADAPTFSALFSSKITKRLLEALAAGTPRNCKPPEEPVDRHQEMYKHFIFKHLNDKINR